LLTEEEKVTTRRIAVLASLPIVVLIAIIKSFVLPRTQSATIIWTPALMGLPQSIKLYRGTSVFAGVQPRAWYIDANYNDKSLTAKPWLATGATGREQGGTIARKLNALVAINGGYFDMQRVPAPTFSLVMSDRKILVPNIPVVTRANPPRAYHVTRSAFGIRANRTFDVAWVARRKKLLWAYRLPVAHTMAKVAAPPIDDIPAGGHAWNVVDAIGAGPTLISDGVIQDTYDNEVFFGAGFPNNERYGRAAIGYTKDNHLILFATDSRQTPDVGLTLAELALEMQRLGCVEAMNLDGGGSETLVVKGQAVNTTPGTERAVTSVLAITGDTASKLNPLSSASAKEGRLTLQKA
jgi:hypothetical protein